MLNYSCVLRMRLLALRKLYSKFRPRGVTRPGGTFLIFGKSCFLQKKVPKTTFFIISSSCVVRMRLLTLKKKIQNLAPGGRSVLDDPHTIFPNFDPPPLSMTHLPFYQILTTFVDPLPFSDFDPHTTSILPPYHFHFTPPTIFGRVPPYKKLSPLHAFKWNSPEHFFMIRQIVMKILHTFAFSDFHSYAYCKILFTLKRK